MTLIPALFNRTEHQPVSFSSLAQPMVDLANLHLLSLCSLFGSFFSHSLFLFLSHPSSTSHCNPVREETSTKSKRSKLSHFPTLQFFLPFRAFTFCLLFTSCKHFSSTFQFEFLFNLKKCPTKGVLLFHLFFHSYSVSSHHLHCLT